MIFNINFKYMKEKIKNNWKKKKNRDKEKSIFEIL